MKYKPTSFHIMEDNKISNDQTLKSFIPAMTNKSEFRKSFSVSSFRANSS